ncbi:hypothetical protein KXW36_000969, partial [Aspergillus fumigatus]
PRPERLFVGKVIKAGDLAVIAHAVLTLSALTAGTMDDECTMRFERGHTGQIFAVQREVRHRPFDRLAQPRHSLMHEFAHMDQDRPRKIRSRLDIGIDSLIHHISFTPRLAPPTSPEARNRPPRNPRWHNRKSSRAGVRSTVSAHPKARASIVPPPDRHG